MRAPGPWPAPTAAWSPAFLHRTRGFGSDGTRILLRGHPLDMRCHTLGFLRVRCGRRFRLLLGQRARMHHHKPEVCWRRVTSRLLNIDAAQDALPPPASGGLLGSPSRFFQQDGE